MKKANLFYTYYDTLFFAKNYKAEVNQILSILKGRGIEVNSILEIGCGTGNHTIELAKKISAVHALDIDEEMIRIAQEKTEHIPNIAVQNTKIEDFHLFEFDASIAMFNVITYITSIPKLISFLKGVSKSLKSGGVFIFDCWNGVAALREPPLTKSATFYKDNKRITCTTKNHTELFHQKVGLEYSIHVYENETTLIEHDIFSFNQFLWTYTEIKYCLKQAGVDLIDCTQTTPPYNPATEKDWKILFICKKK